MVTKTARTLKTQSKSNGKGTSHEVTSLEKKVFDYFTLSQLGKSLIQAKDLTELARIFVSCVYEASHAKNVCLLINDPGTEDYHCLYSIGLKGEKVSATSFKKQEGLFWQVLNGGEPFIIQDSTGHYRFKEIIQKNHLDRLESQIWVPLMVKNTLLGILTLGAKKNKSNYEDLELGFIAQLARQAAIAIDSAILDLERSEATAELAKKMDNLSVLYDVSRAISFTNDLKKTLLLILDRSRKAVKAQKGSIMLLNRERTHLEVKVVRGIDPITERKINEGEIECTKIKIGEGIAGRVFKTGKTMVVEDTRKDSRFLKSDASNVENIVCLPLVAEEKAIGVMNITNKTTGGKFSEEEVEFLSTLAGQVSVTINNANLYHLAITDGLTQLFINRYFHQKLEEEIARSRRYKRPLSLIMTDIDFFKKFNDTYGHQQGDAVLQTTSRLFRQCARDVDIPCRYGGEEFAVILPETDTAGALEAAERIRKAVEAYDFPALKGGTLKVTISVGVATCPDHADSARTLIQKSDEALYVCKDAGRNCSRLYSAKTNQKH